MKNIFRWKGIVAFVIIIGGLSAFFMLFADSLVERSIEMAGTRVVGARVELGNADLSFFPAGLEISRMQVTNPDAPMKNAVDISRLAFGISPLHLLRKKIIIDEMAVEGVRFNTDRKTSGAVPALTGREQTEKPGMLERFSFRLPSLDVEDVKTILEKENLRSLEEAERLRRQIAVEREKFAARLETLPDEESFRRYETRIKALKGKSGLEDLLTAAGEINSLQQDIRADLARIRQARDDVRNSLAMLRDQVATVAQSPQQDIRRLKEKYSLTPQGMGNMTALLFGPRYGQWVETGLVWYNRLQPVFASGGGDTQAKETRPARGRGANVRFFDRFPLPDFLIRRAAVSVATSAGNITGVVSNITGQQHLVGKPLTFVFSSEHMEKMDAIEIKGELNHIDAKKPSDTMHASVRGVLIDGFTISRDDAFPLTLASGRADGDINVGIQNNALQSGADIALKKAIFTLPGKTDINRIEAAVIDKLADVSQFTLRAEARGTTEDFSVNIDSNIDAVIKDTVTAAVGKSVSAFEARLSRAVLEKTGGPINSLRDELGGMDLIEQELTERLRTGDQVLALNPLNR